MNRTQHLALLVKFFGSLHFTLDEKTKLREKMKLDSSEQEKETLKKCELSLPDAELKEKIWKEAASK